MGKSRYCIPGRPGVRIQPGNQYIFRGRPPGGHFTRRETWSVVLELIPQQDKPNALIIHAIVPVEGKTYLFGEDMLILKYDGSDFTQVGETSRGNTLGACLVSEGIICVGTYGDRYITLSDLDAAG